MNLKLHLVKDELPELVTWSDGYGGQWSSDYVILFEPNGFVETRKLTISGQEHEKECATANRHLSGCWLISPVWMPPYVAWCYSKDVEVICKAKELK